MNLTWYGNACVAAEAGGAKIVFDPFVSRNPSLPALNKQLLKGADAIFITHGHFDHAADLEKFARFEPPVYAPPRLAQSLRERFDSREINFREAEYGMTVEFNNLRVTPYRAKHIRFDAPLIASTLFSFIKKASPQSAGALISLLKAHAVSPMIECAAYRACDGQSSLLHFGSLALDRGEKYPKGTDVLSLPIQGHSKIADKAFEIIEELKPKSVFLHHFDDSFPPLSQTIETDELTSSYIAAAGLIKIIKPEFGKTIKFS